MTKHHLFFLTFLFFVLTACNTTPTKTPEVKPFANCQYGPPNPIFSKEIAAIESHEFQLNVESAVEKVVFKGNIQLELIQTGCEKPRQEFQFTLPTSTESYSDDNWIDLSLDMFVFMGNLTESLKPFLIWQGGLRKKRKALKLGLPQELDKGFFVKLDKVAGTDSGMILITLYQE